jgi:hypothetical protein
MREPNAFPAPLFVAPYRARERAVAVQCAALLFAQALKPLATSLGFYGDVVVSLAAESAARAETAGLTGLFERALATSGGVASAE